MARRLVLPAAVGLLAALVCAPWIAPSLVWCGWLGIAAGLLLATNLPWRSGLLCGLTASALAICAAFYWAPHALAQTMHTGDVWGIAVFAPLALWEAARAWLPFWVAARLGLRAAAVWLPAALVAVVLESVLPTVFPWRFGYMQIAWPVTIQSVDLFGSEWATVIEFAHAGAILCLCNALTYLRTAAFSRASSTLLRSAAVWLCGANLIYGMAATTYWKNQIELAPPLRVALVQVDSTYVGSADRLLDLTRSVSDKVDLVCWPEASGGTYHLDLDRLSDPEVVLRLSRDPLRGMRPWPDPSCPLLFGSQTFSGDDPQPSEVYQSAILLDAEERVVGRYHKRMLMPFGEYVPGKSWVPGIERLFPLPHTVLRGDRATVLHVNDRLRLGPMICYEDMHPQSARSLVANSANLLCALINAARFDSNLTLRQHRLLAQLRAVECRRYLLRASATGETCVITPLGEVQASLPLKTTAVLTAKVALLDGQTWSCQIGNAFPWLCFLALALLIFKRSRHKRRTTSQEPIREPAL